MKTSCATLIALALCAALVACGSTENASSRAVEPAELFSGCASDDPSLTKAETLIDADLDGDGKTEQVHLTGQDAGACADALVVTVGDNTYATHVDDSLDPQSAKAIALAGGSQLVYVTGQQHPRGGFQPHLFSLAGDTLGEVMTEDGNPLLAFTATDGGGLPVTAHCAADGGIVVVTATTHEPSGVVVGWDVKETTFSLEGTTAKETESETVAEAAADRTLRTERPQLFDVAGYFDDCTV